MGLDENKGGFPEAGLCWALTSSLWVHLSAGPAHLDPPHGEGSVYEKGALTREVDHEARAVSLVGHVVAVQ